MKTQNIPFFETNGQRYEIKRNRYLQAEFDKMKEEIQMTEDEQIAYAKETDFENRLEKLLKRKEELYDKYLETFDDKDEDIYKKACDAYDKFIEENGKLESVISKQKKRMLDMGEELIIKALQINEKGENIRTPEQANDIWCNFVDEVGEYTTVEFVAFTLSYIVGADEDIENPFLTQAKAKAEQKANMRKGLKVVK
jgi:hypothetical protein